MSSSVRAFCAHAGRIFTLLLALALIPLLSQAQTFRGTILGTVTDASGAVVVGAKVTVRNVATGLVRESETAEDGSYTVPELPIGDYSVTVEKSGFQTAVVTGVRVEVAGERRVDATLRPGQVTQRIKVSGEELPLVETTADVLGGAFESRQVLDLPINGRDYTKLLIMVPGAAGEPNGGGDSPGSFGLFSANGNRGRSNNFLLDGTDMNDGFRNLPAINQGGVFGTPGTVLPVEAIAELRVLSNFEPEYGRNSGSVVNIVTKSGTNELHGSLFDYFRHRNLNARNFFNTEPNPKDRFQNHQFGVSAGGPLAKDQTFWYGAYEGQRERVGVTSLNAVPTLADFADAVENIGGNRTLCTSTIIACISGQASGVINPVILNLFRLCDSQGGCSGDRNVWPTSTVASAPAFNDADSFIAKLDHNFNERNLLSGRYFFGNSDQSFPLGLAGGNNLPNTNTFSPIRAQLVSVSFVRVFSPQLVNEARFGWNLYQQDFLSADRDVFGDPTVTLFGFSTGLQQPRDFGLPQLRVSGLSGLGSSGFSNPRGRDDTNWHLIDNVSWKLSGHDIKFGYEFRRTAVNSFYDAQFRGVLNFDALEDFLEGNVSGGRIAGGNTDREARQNSHAFYIQDSYRWRSSVTFNFGVRWDYFGVIHETGDRFAIYDPTSGLVAAPQLYEKDYNNFSPRLSFAWDIAGKGKTVVRGGYGLFYDIFSQDFFTGQIFFNSFMPGVAYNPIAPDPVLFSFSPVSTLALNTAPFDPASFASDTTDAATVGPIRTPYVQNYNLNIQQELFRNMVLQFGYVGSTGRKLFRFRDINQPSAANIRAFDVNPTPPPSTCSFIDVPRNFTTPLSPLAPNAPCYINQLETSANSQYHALQVSLNQRSWRGLAQQLTWTYAHSIDTASDGQDFVPNAAQPNDSTNPRGDRGNSNFDTRHRFVWSSTYDFPKWEPLARFGEGWQVSGVLTLMTGHPFHVNYNFLDDYDGSGEFFGRPDLVGAIRYNRGDPNQFLDLTAFAVPCTLSGGTSASDCLAGSRHFGDLGRNSLLGPGYRNFDFAVVKMTRLTEWLKLQFRIDVFNLTNHPNFANPLLPSFIADAAFNGVSDGSSGQPALGRSIGFLPITATSDIGLGNPILGGGGPRSVQFAVKFIF